MKVCRDAVNKWGETSQMLVAAEEAAELNQAILKYINRGGSINEVIQELADVIIMIEQLKLMVNEKKLKSQLARKERRLKELIRKSDNSVETVTNMCYDKLGGEKNGKNTH